jgi:phosphoenolpyruvate-protein kinase (PTS system EI component)
LAKRQVEQQARQEQEHFNSSLHQAAEQWETAKRKTDADYKPKADDKSPDGKWEAVRDKYVAMLNQRDLKGQFVNVVRNEKDMLAMLERAYTATDGMFKSLGPKKHASRRTLTSNGSSRTSSAKTIESAGSLREAVEIALAGRG